MKRKIENIISPTIEQLKEYLNRIKWDLIDVGCDHYRIANHHGTHTVFEILNGSDELKSGIYSKKIFGDEYSGTFVIKLSAIKLSYINDINPFVSISLNKVNPNKFFISFYNH